MSLASNFTYPPQDNGEPRDGMYEKIIISAITCLFIVTFLLCLRFVYVSWVSEQPTTSFRRTRRRLDSTGPRFYFTGQEPERLRNVELDSVILETLPIFLYKSQNFTDGLECAVCLCGFEENEKGRLLPNCRHSFHVECIDMWFLSHSTCPLCRTAAQPEQPVDIPMMPDGFSFTRLRSLTRMVSRDRARTQVFDRSPELTVSLSSGDREGAQVFSSD